MNTSTTSPIGLLKRAVVGDGRLLGRFEGRLHNRSIRRSNWGPFNSQLGRVNVVSASLLAFEPELIVETGSYFGATTNYLADCLPRTPLVAFEVDSRYANFTRERLGVRDRVEIVQASSGSRRFPETLARFESRRIWAYLDAHWGAENPLPEELQALRSTTPDWLAVIDDAQVPGDDGYGYDDADKDAVLTSAGLGALGRRLDVGPVYYPTLPSRQETGAVRGTAYLGQGAGATVLDSLRASGHLFEEEVA